METEQMFLTPDVFGAETEEALDVPSASAAAGSPAALAPEAPAVLPAGQLHDGTLVATRRRGLLGAAFTRSRTTAACMTHWCEAPRPRRALRNGTEHGCFFILLVCEVIRRPNACGTTNDDNSLPATKMHGNLVRVLLSVT